MERIDYEDLDRRLKSPDWRFEMDRDELRLLFTLAGSSVSRELYEARWREREAVIKQRNEAIAERDNLRNLLHECRGKIMGDQLASMGEPIVKTVGEPVVIDEGLNARSKRLRAAGATPSIMVCGVSQVTVSHRWLDDGTLCITLADVKPS